MSNKADIDPEVVILGIANHVARLEGLDGQVARLDIVGLTSTPVSPIYPWDLSAWHLVLAVRVGTSFNRTVQITAPSGRPTFSASITAESVGQTDGWWETMALPLQAPELVIAFEPGEYVVTGLDDHCSYHLGYLHFRYVVVPALTIEQVRAIDSNPTAPSAITMRLGSTSNERALLICAATERSRAEAEILQGAVWYQDLPDEYAHSDDEPSISLKYLRQNMHALLLAGDALRPDGRVQMSALWSPAHLSAVLEAFVALLDSRPPEEDVQAFIASNLFLLCPYGAHQIFLKPPVLNIYRADFGILNSKNELVLIEIERPGMVLFRADGARSAKLETAFNQVRSWDEEIVRYREAVLRGISGCPLDVARVRFSVVAGRTRRGQSAFVARTRSDLGPLYDFQTYDELLLNIASIIRHANLLGPYSDR